MEKEVEEEERSGCSEDMPRTIHVTTEYTVSSRYGEAMPRLDV